MRVKSCPDPPTLPAGNYPPPGALETKINVMQEETSTHQEAPTTPHDRTWIRSGFFNALGAALLALLALILWHVTGAILQIFVPFLLGTVLAVLLDPLADRMEARGLSRIAATGLVFGVFLFLVFGSVAVLIPALTNQVSQLADDGPAYVAKVQSYTNDFLLHHRKIGNYKLPRNFNALVSQLSDKVSTTLSASAGHIAAFLVGSFATLLDSIIILIVTFYVLLDIDRFRARLLFLTPERSRRMVRVFAHDIGRVFSDYLRGMVIVCVVYGVLTLLLLLGLSLVHHEVAQYALLVGVAGGILYVVPYLGPIVTALITFLVTFAAGGIGFGGVAVLLTLVLTQLFDNIVTPRIVGGGVGLHPVVALFALALGGTMFGFWGLLLSVPVAASIQVILFRLFPGLTVPTPASFLREQGVGSDEKSVAKVRKDDQPDIPTVD